MTAGDWAAIAAVGAVVISAIALVFSIRSAVAAERAAKAAEAQTEIQQQIQVAGAQPYVWADVREDDSQGVILDLVVGNSGPSVATNVRAHIEPPFPTVPQLEESASSQLLLREGICSIPPGAVLRWHLGQGFNLVGSEGQQRHEITITANGPFGPIPPLTYVVDLANLRGQPIRPRGSLHLLTKAVENLAKKIT